MSYIVFGKENCIYCDKAKELLSKKNVNFKYIDIKTGDSIEIFKAMFPASKTVPQILEVKTTNVYRYIGGYTNLEKEIDDYRAT